MSAPPLAPALQALFRQAVDLHRRGAYADAEALYRRVTDAAPGHGEAQHMLGMALHQQGRSVEALPHLDAALAARGDDAALWSNRGIVLRALRRHGEALAAFDRAAAIDPGSAQAHNNRGNVLRDLGRAEEAIASYGQALAVRPGYAGALRNRADVLHDLGRLEAALADCDALIALDARDAQAWFGRAKILTLAGRRREALEAFDATLRAQPDHVEAHANRAMLLLLLAQPGEALAGAQRALLLAPSHVVAWLAAAGALGEMDRDDDAARLLADAQRRFPDVPEIAFERAAALMKAYRADEAIPVYAALAERWPEHPLVVGQLLHARMLCCDWTDHDALRGAVVAGVRAGRPAIEPFAFQGLADDVRDLRDCAVAFVRERYDAPAPPAPRPAPPAGRRLRIGYVSGEFREQATAILMAQVIEAHDRARVEVVAVDNTQDDGSAMRRRLLAAFDRHVPIAGVDDERAAAAVRAAGVDVLVNLNGWFGRHRLGVFALRPAGVQVNYLGFPGTIGHACIDYIVADAHVIPPGDEGAYVERVVRLPGCYQANDARRAIAQAVPARAEAGLPDDGVVFCCFNNNYKIVPAVYDRWMRLLREVPGSVLWLIEDNRAVAANLRREAAARGVDGARIVFARRVPNAEHLARHRLADLFVDTLPYNAHTTASDALWAGLPLVTCEGTTFPGRVAASLLRSLGLPELVTRDLDAYEALARDLARDEGRRAALRARLADARQHAPLFDGAACARHLEAAYVRMVERAARGEPPEGFDVPPSGG